MSVQCSMCGRLSQDPEFCDYCNADLGKSGQNLPPDRCSLAANGELLTPEQRHALTFPEASIFVDGESQRWRVHWVSSAEWRERGTQLEKRLALRIAALPEGRLIDAENGRWLAFPISKYATPAWVQPALDDPLVEMQRMSACLHSLVHTLESLHQNSLVWLNFDPNALEDAGPLKPYADSLASADWRSLRITNLDVELFPFQSMPERVRVHPHYTAPEVVQFRVDDIGPRTDVFHLAMFAYYWIARQLPDGLPGTGLESYDYALPNVRVFSPHLPEGIIPVLMRALALQPRDRPATPQAFVHGLDEAVINAYRRRAYSLPVRWDTGGETRVGRSKAELQRSNEDTILIKDDANAALALVADGVSTCDIGSGGLASTMTSIIVENAMIDGCTHESFAEIVGSATRRGSEGLLEWALAQNCREELEAGKDLMGTTLTVAWLQGHELSLANLGDSRAYLVTDELVEQLTVDGDLASDLLARGAAPEEIKELGIMARALRECVGGCTKADDGKLTILPDSCQPKISRWPVVPGDVIVLCTDGLVEEGFFLEPMTVANIIRSHREMSAAGLAHLLVETADSLQRVPSIVEPDGFGDNISCVVLKIT